ncbi:MAG: NifB/NifX family molybdenum-iron cluster-binding protein [Candidatus Asgardarchaeia archaeon]
MRIAIPSTDRNGLDSYVEEHFGRAQYYTIIDIDEKEKKIINVKTIETPFTEHGPGDIPNWLHSNNVDLVLALGMGPRAVSFFETLGIKVITGVTGKIKDVIDNFLRGTLQTIEWKHEHEHGQHEHKHQHF